MTLKLAQKALDLNLEHVQIVEHLARVKGMFSCNLLNGVTGSGKTEVYLHASNVSRKNEDKSVRPSTVPHAALPFTVIVTCPISFSLLFRSIEIELSMVRAT